MSAPTRPIPHGTQNGYIYYGCRCDECRRANRDTAYQQMRKRYSEPVPPWAPHGSYTTYRNYGCRCRPCTDDHTARCRDYQRRRRATRLDKQVISAPSFPGARVVTQ